MQSHSENSAVDYSRVIERFLDDMESISPNPKTNIVPLGLSLTDYLIGGGLRPGELSLVAGTSNIGKSSLAAHITQNVAVKQQQRVLVYTLQKTISSFMLSVLASHRQLDRGQLERAALDNSQWSELALHNQWGTHGCIRLQDSAGLDSFEDLSRSIAEVQADSFAPSLIIIDNLQMLVGGEYGGERLQSIVCDLKRVAAKTHAAVLLISHVNIPTQVPFELYRLVDSAFVLTETKNRHEIKCTKNAHGGVFRVPLSFVVEKGLFEELRATPESAVCNDSHELEISTPLVEELEAVSNSLQENRALLIRHGHFFSLDKKLNRMAGEMDGTSDDVSPGLEERTRQRIQGELAAFSRDLERIIEACRLNTTFECAFKEAVEVLDTLLTTEEVANRLGIAVANVEGLMRKAGFKRVRIPYASSGYPRIFWTEEAYQGLVEKQLN